MRTKQKGKNSHGLSRNIPENVKRLVRQRCGFGCVICGATITEYEHFAPNFSQAQSHDANGITLLCPQHHGMVTKGIIPKSQVARANAEPEAIKSQFSRECHPWFEGVPSLQFGDGALVNGTPIPLRIRGEDIITFQEPEVGSNVTRVSALIRDYTGQKLLRITNNEWFVDSGTWDFESRGPRYIFRDSNNKVVLQLCMDAPRKIKIEVLRTIVAGIPVEVNEEELIIGPMSMTGCISSNVMVGFNF